MFSMKSPFPSGIRTLSYFLRGAGGFELRRLQVGRNDIKSIKLGATALEKNLQRRQ
jgi:hypothetical protein